MNKYIILSSNHNPDYEFYLPIASWAWEKIGWKVVVLRPFELKPYREETITQVIRLYAAWQTKQERYIDGVLTEGVFYFQDNDMLMTSDADMIPLSDYWKPELHHITTYGRDLTDYHYPICYIAANRKAWCNLLFDYPDMDELYKLKTNDWSKELIKERLKNTKALSKNFSEWWGVDQDIITEQILKAKAISALVDEIDRGTDTTTGYPKGRFDRSGMRWPQDQLIDFHAPKKGWEYSETIKAVLKKAFGEYPEWLDQHINDYKNKATSI